ncbi:hypothetical protein OG898_19175 [Streptomyces sp. NBC_00193]|uniref:hypothetical protein n=1 Tax=unclassified Streptomyces TaxID=2593676 RepID=UPI00224CF24B|nr:MULTISPECIES: hypothetical protein [unclassified Streptomyces]MCX5125615.1 hypothetical protein [Streptomyces sp. NBC_00347]MCX5298579.1 hypothetical protein [Streptomyces sp. NBC_00193]
MTRTPGTPPLTPGPFGPTGFQLVLLRRMADFQPGLAEEARMRLGASLAEQREANKRWQAMVRSPRSRGALARYRSVLGPPEAVSSRTIGDLTCEALLWPVPLWPGLRFEVLAAPDGAVWNEWLVRAPGAPGPVLESPEDLLPWSATVDEVARAFAPVRPMEGTAPTRWRLAFTASGRACVAEFTYGLLQEVSVQPDRQDTP